MKKKTVKKLVLAKETVRSLEQLTSVRAGYNTLSCNTHLCEDTPTNKEDCPTRAYC